MFIEFNSGSPERVIVNVLLVKKIIPVVNGSGCVIHFDQGTINVKESYEDVITLLGMKQKNEKR